MNVGPDVWNNAPDGSAPVEEISPWLVTMRDAAENWRHAIRAKEDYWNGKIDTLVTQIDGLAAVIDGQVFLNATERASYDVVCNAYQDLKDKLTLSPDFYLTQFQQDSANNDTFLGKTASLVESIFAQIQAGLRQLFGGAGIVLGGAILLVVVYLYFKGRK